MNIDDFFVDGWQLFTRNLAQQSMHGEERERQVMEHNFTERFLLNHGQGEWGCGMGRFLINRQ